MSGDPIFSLSKDFPSSLPAFLAKWKPFRVSENDCEWIWVEREKGRNEVAVEQETVVQAGKEILAATTRRVQEIGRDPSIPNRSVHAKPGQPASRSKAQLIAEVQSNATEELRQLSINTGFTRGKLLVFDAANKIDRVFSELATSLICGSLGETVVHLMKVSPSKTNGKDDSHLICLYVSDVYQKESIAVVLRVLAQNHGILASTVKSDLYTHIDLYSKHASGLRASVWTARELTDEGELKES